MGKWPSRNSGLAGANIVLKTHPLNEKPAPTRERRDGLELDLMHALDTTPALRLEGQNATPKPFTENNVDLRGFHFIPLDIRAFLDLDINVKASGEGFRAGMTLIIAAWQQIPAGSLPKDEALLCRHAGLGRDLGSWREIAGEALAQWVECSDGRLYHPVLSQWVGTSWAQKKTNENRTQGATAARAAKRDKQANDNSTSGSRERDDNVTSTSAPRDVHQGRGSGDGERSDQKRQNGEDVRPSAPSDAASEEKPAYAIDDGVVKITEKMLETLKGRYPGVNVAGKLSARSSYINGKCKDGRADWKALVSTILQGDYEKAREQEQAMRIKAEAEVKFASKPKLSII